MESGIKFTLEKVVTNEMTARNMASGTLDVFATPSMIALIEETAWKSVAQELEEGMGTVGISLNVEHVAPTPVGMKVRCETELEKVDGRKLDFKVEVYDECDLIGKGTHSRFIVKNDKFQIKANGKLGKA
jgi:fluoroacetyl-CoA thioesterase